MMEAQDSTKETLIHREKVVWFIAGLCRLMMQAAEKHDESKLHSPEKELFDIATPKLKGLTYGSEEYKAALREIRPALDHHYANNRHHPEYFEPEYYCPLCGRIESCFDSHDCYCQETRDPKERLTLKRMNLVDLVEMLCDWKAASLRHNDGDIRKSIELNQKRFNYSDDIKAILLNTAAILEKV